FHVTGVQTCALPIYPQITLCLDQVLHNGTPYPNGEVESGSRALAVVRNIFQVIDDIDATHEADAAINDSNLAVKPAQALELETKSAQTIGLRPVNPQLSSHLLEQDRKSTRLNSSH